MVLALCPDQLHVYTPSHFLQTLKSQYFAHFNGLGRLNHLQLVIQHLIQIVVLWNVPTLAW
jgi:hypothetical protein